MKCEQELLNETYSKGFMDGKEEGLRVSKQNSQDAIIRPLKIGDEIYIRANINEIRNDYIICNNKGGYFGTVREEIYPSVQLIRNGHWIPIPYQLDYESDVRCSECGAEIIDGENFKCCPYCFADMRGTE